MTRKPKIILVFSFLLMSTFSLAQDLEVIGRTEICLGDELRLFVKGDTVHKWALQMHPEDIISEENPFVDTISKSENYLLYTSNDTLLIPVFLSSTDCACKYFVPNVFTPDGDYWNENFIPIVNCDYVGMRTTIYDRANRIVFDSNELEPKWNGDDYANGKQLMSGQYVYQITILRSTGEKIELIGFVMLLR